MVGFPGIDIHSRDSAALDLLDEACSDFGSRLFPLVPKVSAALWERTREAKLRFGGRRVRMGTAFDLPRALDGRRSLGGTSVPQALRCLWEREGGTWEREVVRLGRELRAGT